jgi:hypothetical protein
VWFTHSEPAEGYATVEPGLVSRSITMFKQNERPPGLRVSVQTVDSTDPFNQVTHAQIWPAGRGITYRLVPSPIGRISRKDVPLGGIFTNYGAEHSASYPADHIDFTDTEPGLYAGYLATPNTRDTVALSHHPGFIWIPHNSAVDTIPSSFGGYGSHAMLTLGWCDPDGRNALNSGGYFSTGTHEVLGYDADGNAILGGLNSPWYPCGSGGGGGGGGPGGNGGGGA